MSPLPREWTRRICPEMPPLLLLVPVLWFLPLSGAAPSPAAEQLDTGVVSFLTFSTWVGGGGMKFCCLLPLLDMGGKFFPLDTTTTTACHAVVCFSTIPLSQKEQLHPTFGCRRQMLSLCILDLNFNISQQSNA